jgi:hypothetical protein
MPKVSREAFRAFNEGLDQCMKKLGGGKIGMDSICVGNMVRANKDAAYRYVEIHCVMAQSQPGYLQFAIAIATAYYVEFQDDTLAQMVMNKVNELGAEKHLASIGYAKNLEAVATEPPEREAARAWWRKTGRTEASCDNCNRPLRRGEGYSISGRIFILGNKRIEMGDELICQECFDSIK